MNVPTFVGGVRTDESPELSVGTNQLIRGSDPNGYAILRERLAHHIGSSKNFLNCVHVASPLIDGSSALPYTNCSHSESAAALGLHPAPRSNRTGARHNFTAFLHWIQYPVRSAH